MTNSPSNRRSTRDRIAKLTRRRFLEGVAGSACAAATWTPGGVASASQTPGPNQTLVSAQGREADEYGLGWVADARDPGRVVAGFRGHAAAQHARRPGSVLMFARRPGTRAIEVELESGSITGGFECAPDRHLFGHGCFSSDASVLFTTEADLASGRGLVVIRDASSYRVLDEFASGGIGPHELALLPDGQTLVVANGGIATHPDTGRTPLNLDTMESSVDYIDLANRRVLDSFRVPEPKASLRHLAIAEDGTAVVGAQVQREATGHSDTVALAAIQRPGRALELLTEPEPVVRAMRDYVGSVAVSNRARIAGFTSPRGNLAAFWHIDTGEFAAYHELHDVCGIATSGDDRAFLLTSSGGHVRELDSASLVERRERRRHFPALVFDNHLTVATR